MRARIFFLLGLTLAISGFFNVAIGQSQFTDSTALRKNATYQETIDWLDRYWFPYMGIGIDDRLDPVNGKTNVGFYKGFKLVGSDQCILTFRNEGTYKNEAKNAYLVEATIPLTVLNSDKAEVGQRPPFSPEVDELYGRWSAKFVSMKYDLDISLDFKVPDKRRYTGSIVNFTFPSKEGTIHFSKAFLHAIKVCRAQ